MGGENVVVKKKGKWIWVVLLVLIPVLVAVGFGNQYSEVKERLNEIREKTARTVAKELYECGLTYDDLLVSEEDAIEWRGTLKEMQWLLSVYEVVEGNSDKTLSGQINVASSTLSVFSQFLQALPVAREDPAFQQIQKDLEPYFSVLLVWDVEELNAEDSKNLVITNNLNNRLKTLYEINTENSYTKDVDSVGDELRELMRNYRGVQPPATAQN